MTTATTLKELNDAVMKDEKEITINEPAITEIKVLSAKDIKALTNVIKGTGLGVVLTGAATLVNPVLGAAALVAGGLFSAGKAVTYDLAKGIKSDKELRAAQKAIIETYPDVDAKNLFETLKKYYRVTSEGKSFTTMVHTSDLNTLRKVIGKKPV